MSRSKQNKKKFRMSYLKLFRYRTNETRYLLKEAGKRFAFF